MELYPICVGFLNECVGINAATVRPYWRKFLLKRIESQMIFYDMMKIQNSLLASIILG